MSEVLKLILEFLGPIAVVIVGAQLEHSRRVEKLEKESAARDRKDDKDAINRKIEALENTVNALSEKVDSLTDTVSTISESVKMMRKMDSDIQQDLHQLREYHERITRQVNTLANVVIVLSEGMRDNHIDGNVSKAVAAYKQFESEQLAELLASPAIHPTKSDD